MVKLHEEGEPTNSVSSGGIDAPESKLGDKIARRKKKKVKSFKDHINEGKLYRGYDSVKIKEKTVITYGILRKYIKNKKGTTVTV